jgi:hypothetical protein
LERKGRERLGWFLGLYDFEIHTHQTKNHATKYDAQALVGSKIIPMILKN